MDIQKLLQKFPLRLILSVAAGIAISMILSALTHELLHLAGVFPPPKKPMFETNLLIIALLYHSFYAVVGAFITAYFAKDKARKAVFFLGSKEAVMWLLGILLLWKHSAPWYNLSKAVLGIPLALLGGKIYQMYKERKNPDHSSELKTE